MPNFIIRKFRVPPFLLPIYQAAGIEYGVRWEVLAAINEIETDYGRNLNVSSAGALGWMQFMPATWKMYGTDANKDGRKDPYNPVDAIFAAARYLKAANYENDVRAAIWAYNHADWYVDSVLLRARLIAGVPADLIGSLTGLTEGRFPVVARARYADDLAEQQLLKRVQRARTPPTSSSRTTTAAASTSSPSKGAPVVAVNDGVVKAIGRSKELGRYVVLQDVYGNRYTYAHLGEVSRYYPVPKRDAAPDPPHRPRHERQRGPAARQARLGRPPVRRFRQDAGARPRRRRVGLRRAGLGAGQAAPVRPPRPPGRARGRRPRAAARGAGAQGRQVRDLQELLLAAVRPRPEQGPPAPPQEGLARDRRDDHRPHRPHVPGRAAHLDFSIRPAGRGAPVIDPKPILDGWKLLEATAIYRASGRNVLYGKDNAGGMSIGQIMLLPKPLLEKRVLSDERIEIYECGRDDIRSGQIDRRVLATLAYLAESGLKPTVTSLKCGHGFYTSSGNVSHHSSGNAVDIATINGIPILGHQEPGGITEQAVRRLMQLQGTMAPAQIISLFEIGGATFAMADHDDHIHVGFQPMFGANKKLGKQALAVLEPGQWSDLISRLREIDNPVVPTKPSKYALPAKKQAREPRPRGRVGRRPSPAPRGPFGFVQLEFGFLLGPPDGRYLVRRAADALVEAVLVLGTLGAPERARLERGGPRAVDEAEPEPVPTSRATVVSASRSPHPAAGLADAGPRSGARPRCRDLEPGAARPARRGRRPVRAEVSAERALVVRIGYGSGEEVADGRFGEAVELPRAAARRVSARWRRPRSASPPCSAATRRSTPPRSSCCAPAPI